MKIHILAGDLRYFNTKALLYPFLLNRESLADCDIYYEIFSRSLDQIKDCDIVIIDSKVFRNLWGSDPNKAYESLSELGDGSQKTVWFNTGDSTGGVQKQVIDVVDRYYKGQLLKDRSQYERSYYGGRIYTDYYHDQNGIRDDLEIYSPSLNQKQISKLRLSWNLGMNPCITYAKNILGRFIRRSNVLRKLPPININAEKVTDHNRENFICSRVKQCYSRSTVGHQRLQMSHYLEKYGCNTSRISMRNYYKELHNSKYAISPFGWGEICIRDFEAIVHGSVLLKPDVTHLETWPNIYLNGETYLSIPWDLECFEEWYADKLLVKDHQKELSVMAIEQYVASVGHAGASKFVEKITELVKDLDNEDGI